MKSEAETQEKYISIKEVAENTGIGASTIRYYDQQFEDYLQIKRGNGRRRLFSSDAVERLMNLHHMLKEQGLSMRQARQALSSGAEPVAPGQGVGQLETQLAELRAEVGSLKNQVAELKDIQARTLALLDNLT